MSLSDDGRVVYHLRRPWPNAAGVLYLVLQPTEFLRRLAALVPAPYANLVRYHGVFAGRSRWRDRLPVPPGKRTEDVHATPSQPELVNRTEPAREQSPDVSTTTPQDSQPSSPTPRRHRRSLPSFSPKEFVADYLHIIGGDFRSATTNTTTHGLLRAHPTARARAAGFPTLEADSTIYPYASLGGVPFYDAMFQPTLFPDGGLDTLYTAEPARPESGFNGKPIAWRYADPSDTPRQGPVAITSFPLQMMKEGEPSRVVDGVRVPGTGMAGLVEVLGMWFREHAAVRVQ